MRRGTVEFLAGLVCGMVAGVGLLLGLDEGDHGIDLVPPVGEWPLIRFVALAAWLVGLAVVVVSRRRRLLALGWVIGVPVLFLIQVGYALVTFGTIGYLPEP